MLSLGYLSLSVITPRSLKGLLLEIQNLLSEYLRLLYNQKGEIWGFYQTLTCTTTLDMGKFLVIVSFPLLESMKTFEIFNVFNMPIPVKDTNVPTDKLPSMVAWYKLETSSITVNLAEIKYVLLTATQQEHHTSLLRHYCDVRSPVYSMTSSKIFTVALFMKDTENVKIYCKTKVEPNSILPRAYYVIDSLWLISTQNTLTFTVVCPQKQRDSDCSPTSRYS